MNFLFAILLFSSTFAGLPVFAGSEGCGHLESAQPELSLPAFVEEYNDAIAALIHENSSLTPKKLRNSSVVKARWFPERNKTRIGAFIKSIVGTSKENLDYVVLLTDQAELFPDHTGAYFIFDTVTKKQVSLVDGYLELADGSRLGIETTHDDGIYSRWLGHRDAMKNLFQNP